MNNIVNKAFNNELNILIKSAGLLNFLPKLMEWGIEGKKIISNEGLKEGLNYFEKFKTPVLSKINNTLTMASEHPNTGWLQKGVGDFIGAVKDTSSGLSSSKNLLENTKQVGKNLYGIAKSQIENARYRTIGEDTLKSTGVKSKIFGNPKIVSKDGKDFLKGRLGFSDRAILGKTEDGKYILKKRVGAQALGIMTTPTLFAGQAALLPNPDSKNNSLLDRAKRSLGQFALWTGAKPIAEADLAMDTIRMFNKKPNVQTG